MYPTIYHAVLDLFGLDIPGLRLLNSFGFFVALGFLAASWVMSRELRRKEAVGLLRPTTRMAWIGRPASVSDLVFSFLLGFIVGFKGVFVALNADLVFAPGQMPQQYLLSFHGNWPAGLLLGGGLLAWKYFSAKKAALPEPKQVTVEVHPYEHTGNITMIAAAGGVAGAKLFHLFENPREFVEFFTAPTLEGFLSGLTIYGGLIVGGLAVWLYSRKIKVHIVHLMDATAPGLMLSYGIGRMGCHVSGDGDWGIVNTAPMPGWLSWLPEWVWAYDYPNNVNGVGVPMAEGGYEGYGHHLVPPVFPTPIYEITAAIILFAILWRLKKHVQTPLVIFSVYLMMNGFERFWIEKIRVNEVINLAGMSVTQAEIIATLTFFTGLGLFIWLRKNPGWRPKVA